MYFEVNITPKEKAAAAAAAIVEPDPETKFSLSLAPFQPQTHVIIETELYTTAKCYLSLKNPSNRSLNVRVSKKPPPERSVALNLSELKIGPQEDGELVINWTARQPGTSRDIIQLTDSRKIKYNIALTTSTRKSKRNGNFNVKTNDIFNQGAKKKVLTQNTSPKKKKDTKRNLTENIIDDLNSPKKRYKSSFNSKYQGKENISNYADVGWYTPSKKFNGILADIKKERLSDFSMIIESDGFALTPHSWIKNESKEDSSLDSGQFTSQNYTDMLSSPKTEKQLLRRETYITTPGFRDKHFKDQDYKENFHDSLSPLEKNSIKNVNFSTLINELNFETPATNIDSNSVTPKSNNNNNNNTFEIIKSSEVEENSRTVTENFLGTRDINRLVPTRLAKSFARLSPVMPVIEPITTKFATSSSPICGNDVEQISNNFKLNIKTRQLDASSVQEVLEADLWAKPMNQFSLALTRSAATSLESIKEESLKLTPVTNKTYVKCSNDTETGKVSSMSNHRRFEFSPPTVNKGRKISPIRKISPKKFSKVSKDKNVQEIQGLKRKATMNTSLKSKGNVSIPGVRITKLSLAGLSNRKCNNGSNRNLEHEVSTKLHDPDHFFTILCNPDPFAATTTEDPFLASTLYFDKKWVDNQEIEFKKWLNALLTPPEHLTSNVDTPLIDVAKVWQTCRLKEDVSLAETKEAVSARYHTNQRLTTLRRAACTMLRSNEVVSVLSKVTVCVEKGILLIRQDRDLHKDIGLQKLVLELFLSYNPLWLRIALEAIYGETIPLNSNNDIIRLTKFLLNRFFSDPYLVKTHSHHTVQNLRLPTFFPVMNKFMLKKFLMIVYFLDYAKIHKLIGHDPCLFHKQSAFKESKRILLKFSQELLSGVGDVTRVLKPYGYILIHRQTELDEYSYAVDNLSLDLRDGVRLCRVMELITGKRNLTSICRVPAISRLQKVYNVDVALKALTGSGYIVQGNITAKCIADGHREKTLSLLWQIIYKFQAPHFNKAAQTIQRWWSSKILWIRVRNYLRDRRRNAACVIQRAWRFYIVRKELKSMREYRMKMIEVKNNAAKIIQMKWIARVKMMKERKAFLRLKSAAVIVQKLWRNYRATKLFVESFNRKRSAALVIQRRWRMIKSMRIEMSSYLILRDATIRIQIWWRKKVIEKNACCKRYREMNEAAFVIQNKWRAFKFGKSLREDFLMKRKSVIKIQNWWKTLVLTKRIETYYKTLRSATIFIQRRYKAKKFASFVREEFLYLKKNVILVQRRWRANKSMKECRDKFLEKRNAVFKIQEWWKACLKMKEAKSYYCILKSMTIFIQRKYRALRSGESVRQELQTLRNSVLLVQQKWRAKKLSQSICKKFLEKRKATIKIQTWWRALILAKKIEIYYKSLRSATILIQRRYKAKKLASVVKEEFLSLKNSVIYVQRRWRANKSMKECREKFLEKRNAVVKIQEWWRASMLAKNIETYYKILKFSTILIQRKYKAKKLASVAREEFLSLKNSVIYVQQRWRANKSMKECREKFLEKRNAALKIQECWKACLEAKKAKELGQPIRKDFLTKRESIIKIQNWWRSSILTKRTERYYKILRSTTILIQRKYRGKILSAVARENFLTLRTSAMIIQERWRAKRSMKLLRKEFLEKRRSTIKIQIWWKAIKVGRICCENYEKQRTASIKIQRWYRSIIELHKRMKNYNHLVESAITIQRWWKEILKTREKIKVRRTSAATIIQAVWRAHKVRRIHSEETNRLRERSERAAILPKSSDTLGLRLNDAILMFREYGNLGRLTQGLTALDTITHLLPHTSTALCNANLVGELYDVLHRSNRSRPWMDICLRASSILVTIAKYTPTKQYAWREEHVETIVHLMTATLEREIGVFLHLATLLWLLADSPSRIKAIAESPTTVWSLSSMYNTVSKKKINRLSLGPKQSLNTTTTTTTTTTTSMLPNPKPDWGLKHSRPRLFTSVHHAVYTLFKKLQIKNP